MATSLANTTSTRADSASRHMLQCRVHRDRLLSWTNNGCDNSELQRNKHKYSMTKDELALEVSTSMSPFADHYSRRRSQPYPMVLSSFHGMGMPANYVYACLMDTTTPFNTHRKELFERIRDPDFAGTENGKISDMDHNRIKTIPHFRTMGYSVGTAYAHENSGDTIASVMIGGIVTVLNGAFPMQTGDPVMFYLPLEEGMFTEDGSRRTETWEDRLKNPMNIDDSGQVENFTYDMVKKYVEHRFTSNINTGKSSRTSKAQSMKNLNGFELNGNAAKSEVAKIKPFHYKNASDGDYERVFAKVISPAESYDMVDIMISRQSM